MLSRPGSMMMGPMPGAYAMSRPSSRTGSRPTSGCFIVSATIHNHILLRSWWQGRRCAQASTPEQEPLHVPAQHGGLCGSKGCEAERAGEGDQPVPGQAQ